MKRLNSSQLDYILFHLKQHVEIDEEWSILYHLPENLLPENTKNTIVFPLSDDEINLNKTVDFMEKSIPILFTTSIDDEIYSLDKNGNLVFNHDILKSAFYLLSAYQESEDVEMDEFGRFSYTNSIQKRLNITTIPIVNYYFEMIIQGLEEYCKFHSLRFKRKRLFDQFGFFLSHDVDRVEFYHPREVAFKVKQMLGLAPLTYSYRSTFVLFIKGVIHILSPFKKKDPWWNFDWIIQLEKQLNIRSTFFFLKQEHKNRDSRYQFSDNKIKSLINKLISQGFEIGLHGSFDSSNNPTMLKKQADELSSVLSHTPKGIRQHFLRFKTPDTFKHQIAAGLEYDCTLGFAEHDGYRNSYCYPFKPYDFEKNQMLDIWEIPLTMMEVSMLNYRKTNLDELRLSVLHHIEEAKKFGGLFSLLWHNCRLMNEEYSGIEKFYPNLLKQIIQLGADSLTGEEIVNKITTKEI